jgi:hypothetical protein
MPVARQSEFDGVVDRERDEHEDVHHVEKCSVQIDEFAADELEREYRQ